MRAGERDGSAIPAAIVRCDPRGLWRKSPQKVARLLLAVTPPIVSNSSPSQQQFRRRPKKGIIKCGPDAGTHFEFLQLKKSLDLDAFTTLLFIFTCAYKRDENVCVHIDVFLLFREKRLRRGKVSEKVERSEVQKNKGCTIAQTKTVLKK